jgi:poly(A) polymerase
LLVRYKTTEKGKRKKLANIYTIQDHGIARSSWDREALSVTRRLNRAGHEAYVVGGAVRDLMIGNRPKDFDVVTDALPRKIRRIFRNSRIIGRRFQLVHVYFGEKIVEVSTFRTDSQSEQESIFGTMSEDVLRRDYTMNALYYEPEQEYVIDHVGGYEDIKSRTVRALIPVVRSFQEDPVRMIRAIRYAATTGFRLQARVSRHIRKKAFLIAGCPISRLTEELFKMLSSGSSARVFEYADTLELLPHLLPNIAQQTQGKAGASVKAALIESLRELDNGIAKSGVASKRAMVEALVRPFLGERAEDLPDIHAAKRELFLEIKQLIAPLTPPNVEVEKTALRILGISHRKRKPRRSGGRRHSTTHEPHGGGHTGTHTGAKHQ